MEKNDKAEQFYKVEQSNLKIKEIRKPKEERIYVKSNKGTKIELKNLDKLKMIEESCELNEWTKKKLSEIKNPIFKNNVVDIEKNKLVSSVRLVKTSKLGRKVTPLVWEYYKNRANLDVNEIIKKYSRDNLIINYSICSDNLKKKVVDKVEKSVEENICDNSDN